MKGSVKLMIAALAVLLTAPAVFAEQLAVAKKVDNVVNEKVLSYLTDRYENAKYTKNYIRSLEEGLVDNGVFLTDSFTAEDVYKKLVQLSKESEKMSSKKEVAGLRAFYYMSKKFQEELGADPSTATMDQYKKFYQLHEDNPIILPTIAIWANHSFDGILPYRHQVTPFWSSPTQVAKMYNTMAEVDHQKAFYNLTAYIMADFHAAYPTFPEGDLEGGPIQYAYTFFAEFAKEGKYAAQDIGKIQCFVNQILQKKGYVVPTTK